MNIDFYSFERSYSEPNKLSTLKLLASIQATRYAIHNRRGQVNRHASFACPRLTSTSLRTHKSPVRFYVPVGHPSRTTSHRATFAELSSPDCEGSLAWQSSPSLLMPVRRDEQGHKKRLAVLQSCVSRMLLSACGMQRTPALQSCNTPCFRSRAVNVPARLLTAWDTVRSWALTCFRYRNWTEVSGTEGNDRGVKMADKSHDVIWLMSSWPTLVTMQSLNARHHRSNKNQVQRVSDSRAWAVRAFERLKCHAQGKRQSLRMPSAEGCPSKFRRPFLRDVCMSICRAGLVKMENTSSGNARHCTTAMYFAPPLAASII